MVFSFNSGLFFFKKKKGFCFILQFLSVVLIIFPIPIPKLKPLVALQSTGAIRTGKKKKA